MQKSIIQLYTTVYLTIYVNDLDRRIADECLSESETFNILLFSCKMIVGFERNLQIRNKKNRLLWLPPSKSVLAESLVGSPLNLLKEQ